MADIMEGRCIVRIYHGFTVGKGKKTFAFKSTDGKPLEPYEEIITFITMTSYLG